MVDDITFGMSVVGWKFPADSMAHLQVMVVLPQSEVAHAWRRPNGTCWWNLIGYPNKGI